MDAPTWDSRVIFKLIHKKHKDILDAYLADNSVEIEILFDGAYLQQKDGSFIQYYGETFEYRLKPKKKTVSLALFTCQRKSDKQWINANIYETIEHFKEIYDCGIFMNHHEMPNTRYEQEIDE